MYLILPSQQATIRNITEAVMRGCDLNHTKKVWNEIELSDDRIALDVLYGEGLTEEEKAQLVETIEIE